ncbi:hypothetical protein VFPBJ_10692 [Purpureocillium lilacinum]|uniref:Uncharacterized protein n=1 Tax=Purpureocillium lilacinum TaxID=33203 RepID=A0A179FVB9_PURLI|nr:hypothetical protein VFPBJ_10692 [Purpureocillium lilacinum]
MDVCAARGRSARLKLHGEECCARWRLDCCYSLSDAIGGKSTTHLWHAFAATFPKGESSGARWICGGVADRGSAVPASGTQKLQSEAGERMRPGALRIQAGHAKRLCSTRCAAKCRLALRRGATGLLLLTTTPSALPLDRLTGRSYSSS